jgi:hypothetical protein
VVIVESDRWRDLWIIREFVLFEGDKLGSKRRNLSGICSLERMECGYLNFV